MCHSAIALYYCVFLWGKSSQPVTRGQLIVSDTVLLFPAQWRMKWQNLLNLSFVEPRQNSAAILKIYELSVYGIVYCVTNSFCKIMLKYKHYRLGCELRFLNQFFLLLYFCCIYSSRFRWPWSLRSCSAAAWLLGSRFRIPAEAVDVRVLCCALCR